MSIRVIVAGDHRILREGLCGLLAHREGIEVLGEAADAESTMALCRERSPEIVILETDMSGGTGVGITSRIRAQFPGVKVIAHSAPAGRRILGSMLRAGASGYLDRESGFDELLKALDSVATGRPYLGTIAADSLIEELTIPPHAGTDRISDSSRIYAKALTAREIEVLRLLATGKRVKEIARILHISVKTVESHRQNMMDKLEIHNAIELARYALREGLATV
jgi:DNA-binding NarL/FixJ family response regulator